MGLFHCPVGAAFYDDAFCIKCGLCTAQTRAEYLKASNLLRAYLAAHASSRQKKYVIQKIVICGKGGVGKSTIATLLSRCLVEYGYRVLVIDTDESNPGLFRSFGFLQQPKPLISMLNRFSLGEKATDADWLNKNDLTFEDIPSELVLLEGDLRFVMVGKIDDPFQGCACSMADVTRDLILKLDPKAKEMVVVDQEAGVESFGRGVERGADEAIIVVEPSFESIALAEKIDYMSKGIGINRIRVIMNKIPSLEIEEKIIDQLTGKNIRYLGAVYLDSKISENAFTGESLGESAAKSQMKAITRLMLDEAEMRYNYN
jgi:CO dehydrogenase maturation factor